MYHSITFKKTVNQGNAGNGSSVPREIVRNTWTHWHLIPSVEPIFSQPNPVYSYVDIPGKDGSMDFTDYLIGRPTFSDRQGSFEFIIINSYDPTWEQSNKKTFEQIREEMTSFFDGSIIKAFLEDESDYYYSGRFFFKGRTPDASHSKVTIEYRVNPYRYSVNSGEEAGL